MSTGNILYCHHPLLLHHMTIVRDKNTSQESFRAALKRITQIVLCEATKNLSLRDIKIQTPLAEFTTKTLAERPIIIAPILRAGLCMADAMIDLIPTASVYHLGLYREPQTLKPIVYYNKLHHDLNYVDAEIFILDPMLATGGSINQAIDIFKQLGAQEKNIRVVCLIAATFGIKAVTIAHPQVNIVVGACDTELNEHAYIVPGLGDAGDRAFGTLHST